MISFNSYNDSVPFPPLCPFSLLSSHLILSCSFITLFISIPFFSVKQEVLPDRKRVTTRSYLPITPVDTDSGSNFTCVASNLAVPMGKRVTVTLNVHRTLPHSSVRLFRLMGDSKEPSRFHGTRTKYYTCRI